MELTKDKAIADANKLAEILNSIEGVVNEKNYEKVNEGIELFKVKFTEFATHYGTSISGFTKITNPIMDEFNKKYAELKKFKGE